MEEREQQEPQSLSQLQMDILDEVIRQLRSTRNDIIRYGVWNIRNLTDEEFNHTDDRRLLGYFRNDLLETRLLSKGRRVDIVQVWHWFDDQLSGVLPLLVNGREVFLNIQDKDLEKVRKRISELRSFFSTLERDDLDAFRRIKYKLRRTVLRLTYDLHHLYKRLEKYRKNFGQTHEPRPSRVSLEAVTEVPEVENDEESVGEESVGEESVGEETDA